MGCVGDVCVCGRGVSGQRVVYADAKSAGGACGAGTRTMRSAGSVDNGRRGGGFEIPIENSRWAPPAHYHSIFATLETQRSE